MTGHVREGLVACAASWPSKAWRARRLPSCSRSGPRAAAGGDPDRDAAVALLERRRASLEREPDPRKRRQKAYALLARNGFDPGTCREVSSGVLNQGGFADDADS